MSCFSYSLYNEYGAWKQIIGAQHRALNGDCIDYWSNLIDAQRNWNVNRKNKHKRMRQIICQEVIGPNAHDNQQNVKLLATAESERRFIPAHTD